MLTEKQISLIRKNWRQIRGIDPAIVGDAFYSKLFLDLPVSKRMFKSSKSEQALKLIDMFNVIIARLDRISVLNDELKQLAIRHVEYGVKDEHYQYVGNALIWTLKKASQHDWNQELEEAWIECYNLLAKTMIEATK